MTGYCSNSPMRCDNALNMTVINSADSNCPDCGRLLVASNNISSNSNIKLVILQLCLALMAIALLVLVYIYYANFV